MKILQLDFDDLKNPQGGGQAIRTFEVNRRLARKHSVTVVTGNFQGAKNEKIEGIQYIRVGSINFPWNFLSFLWALPEIVKKNEHDLVIENFTPPVGPAMTPLFTKKPVIAMVDWAFAWEMSKKYKLPFFIWQELGLKFYHNFIFPTNAIKDYMLKGREKKIKILVSPNQALSDFKHEPRPNLAIGEDILFIGRLDCHQKGIDLLLEAFKIASAKISGKLLIAGEGRDKKRIEKRIKKLKIEKRVILIGKVIGAKKRELFTRSKIICIPSRYESGCVVAIEALMYKKTIVCFGIPPLKEVTQNQAIFAKAFDVKDLAEKIILATKSTTQIGRKIKYGQLSTWDEIARVQEAFYQKITGN